MTRGLSPGSSSSAARTTPANSRSVISTFRFAVLQHEGDGVGVEPRC